MYFKCIVHDNVSQHRLDLSEALIGLGFGNLTNETKALQDPILKRYNHYLEFIQKQAKKDRQGAWAQR